MVDTKFLPRLFEREHDPDEVPLVSVVCNTYSHVQFIGKCLDGFLMQRADFPVEIFVHDDASTDGTADILKQYA